MHTPKIQILTNQITQFSRLNCGCGLKCSITSVQAESVGKARKAPLLFKVGVKHALYSHELTVQCDILQHMLLRMQWVSMEKH